jgi:hypothetical protein
VTRDNESPTNPPEPKTDNSPRQGSASVKSSRNRPLKASHDIKLINQISDSDDVIHSCSNVGDTNISTGEKTRINSGLNSHVKGRVRTMREGISGAQIVTLDMSSDQGIKHVPSPPPPLDRPSSAQRFRKMVMNSRDT